MNDYDVLIVGAGISGIGSACHLKMHCPQKSFKILESRGDIGGTWDLFQYPGIRSDSDMHTLGFSFKPWTDAKAIADGPSIKSYLKETADEYDLYPHILFNHKVLDYSWSSVSKTWTVSLLEEGQEKSLSCNFLMICSGYYNYEKGYTPQIEGIENFRGTLVHPQHWPKDLEIDNKKIVVIGSGATAMTIVPNVAQQASKVTMLQRSPTYVVARPDQDAIANFLRKWLPSKLAYSITRLKNTWLQSFMYKRMRAKPEEAKRNLIGMTRAALNKDFDVKKHFTPSYYPWDQRLCLLPNGDLYESINQGRVDVITDTIDRVQETGILVSSGDFIEADIIVTATGLNMEFLGGAGVSVDGKTLSMPKLVSYKGMMYAEVPNFIQTFGYINASWTLRADLTSEYACRLLNAMDKKGVKQCMPRIQKEDLDMSLEDWVQDFSAGYMQRTMHLMPKQGSRDPWRNTQNYMFDKKLIREAPLEDGSLIFEETRPDLAVFALPGDNDLESAA